MEVDKLVITNGFKLVLLLLIFQDISQLLWQNIKKNYWIDNSIKTHRYPSPNILRMLEVEEGREEVNFSFPSRVNISGYEEAEGRRRWGQSKYEMSWKISIHVFAWRREKSLRRLGNSLLKAQYSGYEVPIYFHIDGDPLQLVVDYVNEFKWPHGPKIINLRNERLGMPSAILSGWTPTSDEEHAILLEDDIEVAVSFFEYSLYCLSMTTYKRLVEGDGHGMMGCSLYTPRVNEIGPAPNAWSPPTWNPSFVIGPKHRLFYFQLPCSWGAIYHAKYWREFLQYFTLRQQIGSFPETPNSRSNEWFQSWKRILIEFMLIKGWYLLYPSFHGQASFSTNYFEKGIHSVGEGKTPFIPNELRRFGDRRFTVPLIQDFSFRVSLPIPSVGIIKRIPWVNLYHERVYGRQALFIDPSIFLANSSFPELEHFLKASYLPTEKVNEEEIFIDL